MTVTQAAKAQQFRALHEAPDAFVIANVWDGGSARMMAALGFPALATSSGVRGAYRRNPAQRAARPRCCSTAEPTAGGSVLCRGARIRHLEPGKFAELCQGSRRKPLVPRQSARSQPSALQETVFWSPFGARGAKCGRQDQQLRCVRLCSDAFFAEP